MPLRFVPYKEGLAQCVDIIDYVSYDVLIKYVELRRMRRCITLFTDISNYGGSFSQAC